MPRIAILFFFTFFIFGHTAFADETKSEQSVKLTGWWKEFSPSSNLIHFAQDGSVRIMLRKGEIGNLRSLNGTWKITKKNIVHLVFHARGKTMERDEKLSFKGDEMILTNWKGAKTRHRRHSGPLPEKYDW